MKTMDQIYSERIEEILESFNFEKVHAYMTLVKWTWGGDKPPSIAELKATARSLLGLAVTSEYDNSSISTGGFVATRDIWKRGTPTIQLMFYVDCTSRSCYQD